MGKIRRSQRNTVRTSTLGRRRLLRNSLFFLEGRQLIKEKQLTYLGSSITQNGYWEEKAIRSRMARAKNSCSCKKKNSSSTMGRNHPGLIIFSFLWGLMQKKAYIWNVVILCLQWGNIIRDFKMWHAINVNGFSEGYTIE